jgi:hypothetical protein
MVNKKRKYYLFGIFSILWVVIITIILKPTNMNFIDKPGSQFRISDKLVKYLIFYGDSFDYYFSIAPGRELFMFLSTIIFPIVMIGLILHLLSIKKRYII